MRRAAERVVVALLASVGAALPCEAQRFGIVLGKTSSDVVTPFSEDYSIHRFDAGGIFGLGIEARIRGNIVAIEGRYEYGLTDLRNQPGRHSRNGTAFILVNIVPLLK